MLLQLGGSDNTPEGWKAGTATPAATTTLAHSIVGYARALRVDGVTIDWEQDVDERAVGALAHAVRTSWPKAIITVDIDPYDHDLSWASSVAPYVDRVDAMTYVSVGNWGGWQGPGTRAPCTGTPRWTRSRSIARCAPSSPPASARTR